MQPTSSLPWTRFVAIGDSLTEGVGDPVRGGLRGWADRLAGALKELNPELRYWNLARRSLTTAQIRVAQLDRALELKPDLVSIVAGMNDVMDPNFDPGTFRTDLVSLVGPVAESGATVLLGTLPRDLPLLRLMPRQRAQSTRQRLNEVCETVLTVAGEVGAACVDAPEGWRYTMAECSVDGCHPNARGHAHIAELALESLAAHARVSLPPFEYVDCGWLSTSVKHVGWLVSQGFLHPRSVLGTLKG